MAPRTVLITGCSSGIGLALAVRLATDSQGRFKVLATMRDLSCRGPLEEAAGSALGQTLEIGQLDVCDEDSITRCLKKLPGQFVDILVSNAGIGLIGPLESLSLDNMRRVMDTNFFGLVQLVRALMPSMKRQRRGHIVVISSIMGLQGIMFNDIYAASKFAVEGFCESLLVQALRFNISITLVEPGPVTSEFEGKLYSGVEQVDCVGTDSETADIFNRIYLPNSRALFASLSQSPEDVAEHALKVICAHRPPFRHQTNPAYTPMLALKRADPTGELAGAAFYSLVFRHGPLLRASLHAVRFCRWKARKIRQALRLLGLG